MIVCPSCGRENPDDGRFCGGCATPLATATPQREERKVVSVVFVDLVGSTARAERLDPEDVRALLSTYHARVRRELERHGGTVEKFIGDAVVAVFGAPFAHEDDPERAVRAALAIQEAIDELNEAEPALELEVRIGVNTGEALVALEARPESGEGMVSGDVINTAARLQAASPAGGILVGAQTHRATERAVDYAEHEAVEAKGKADPVPAWRAVARRASFGLEQDAVARAAPLVGREREVALLADALARVRSVRRPQLLTLVGVPGIGKSRLVQELWQIVDADPDLITWRGGRSLPYGEGVPFWALGEIVKAQAGILESDDADVAGARLLAAIEALLGDRAEAAWAEQHLRPLVGLAVAERQPSRDEAFAAWRLFLEALAETRPAVLVFEDLHWADDDLLDFVDELTVALDDVPLLLVCTARPELLTRRPGWGGGKLNALTLSLSPLSNEETAHLLHALIDTSVLPAEAQTRIVRNAEGVPLFAEEYARMFATGDAGDLPENLHGLVAARIDALPARDKSLLQDAAVLGKVFWTDALRVLADVDAAVLDERLQALQRQQFVRRERRSAVEGARQHVFVHALLRDVAYGQIPRVQRAEKHRRVAAWIAGLPADRAEDRAEMLAHHLESAISYGVAAGLPVDDLRPAAVSALRDAGDRAWALSLVSRAAQLYGRALEAGAGADPDPELLFLCGQAQLWTDGGTETLREAVDALLAAGNRELAAMAMVSLERGLWRSGDPDASLLDRAFELVGESGTSPTRGRVLAAVAVRRSISGTPGETLALALEAVEIARAHGDRTAEAEALNSLGVVQSNRGETRDAVDTATRALELSLAGGGGDTPRCYVNLATFETDCGLLEQAATHQREGLALSHRVGAVFTARWLDAEIVLLDFVRGVWGPALEEALAGVRRRQAAGEFDYMDTQVCLVGLDAEHACTGRLDMDTLSRTVDAVRAVGDPQLLVPTLGGLGALLATAGLVDEAETLLREYHGVAASTRIASGPSDIFAALAWERIGRGPASAEIHARNTLPWGEAARLLCGRDPVAAADVLAGIGARAVEAPTRLAAAHLLAPSAPAEAERQLENACDIWRSVGATARLVAADEVRARLREAAS